VGASRRCDKVATFSKLTIQTLICTCVDTSKMQLRCQWRKMLRILGVDVAYALSPQAKGKVERPYR